jgi:hypothetical protein
MALTLAYNTYHNGSNSNLTSTLEVGLVNGALLSFLNDKYQTKENTTKRRLYSVLTLLSTSTLYYTLNGSSPDRFQLASITFISGMILGYIQAPKSPIKENSQSNQKSTIQQVIEGKQNKISESTDNQKAPSSDTSSQQHPHHLVLKDPTHLPPLDTTSTTSGSSRPSTPLLQVERLTPSNFTVSSFTPQQSQTPSNPPIMAAKPPIPLKYGSLPKPIPPHSEPKRTRTPQPQRPVTPINNGNTTPQRQLTPPRLIPTDNQFTPPRKNGSLPKPVQQPLQQPVVLTPQPQRPATPIDISSTPDEESSLTPTSQVSFNRVVDLTNLLINPDLSAEETEKILKELQSPTLNRPRRNSKSTVSPANSPG